MAAPPQPEIESAASVKTSKSFVITDPKEISKKSVKSSTDKKEVNFTNLETLTVGTGSKVDILLS